MRPIIFPICLILFFAVKLEAQVENALDLLNKSIAYHDPGNKWANLVASFDILQQTPKKSASKTLIRIDNGASVFETQSKKDSTLILRKVVLDSCYYEVNGTADLTEAQIEKHKLNCKRNKLFRDYYMYLYGLPMKLKDAGTIIDPKVRDEKFQGKTCWAIKVNYKAEVGKDIWYFYFDKNTYALIGYRFYHEEEKNDGEYILLEKEENISGIKMPKIRKWYTNKEDKFLGTDILQKNIK